MSTGDMVSVVGYVVSAWCLGFCGGFVITRFKDAVSQL